MVVVWTKRNFENRFVVKKNMGCVNQNDTQLYFRSDFDHAYLFVNFGMILEYFGNWVRCVPNERLLHLNELVWSHRPTAFWIDGATTWRGESRENMWELIVA